MVFISDGCNIAFLNGLIEEEVCIIQLRGFEVHRLDTHVCRLKKALYGLKQAPCAWYSRIDEYYLIWVSPRLLQIPIFIISLIYLIYLSWSLYVDDLILQVVLRISLYGAR
jgi:hypothetical protein